MKWSLLLILSLMVPSGLRPETVIYMPASQTFSLENAAGSARAQALGSAAVSLGDGASSVFTNPAGLALLGMTELGVHHNAWLVDTWQESGVLGFPLGRAGGLALFENYVDYGNFEGRDNAGNLTSSFKAYKLGGGLGWGRSVMPGFSVGFAAKGSQQYINTAVSESISLDLGALFYAWPLLQAGVAISNIGPTVHGNILASKVTLGASSRFKPSQKLDALISTGGEVEPQGINRIQFGAELAYDSHVAIRAGYQGAFQEEALGGLRNLTAGLGLNWRVWQLDWAYLPFGDLGGSQRLSLSYKFDHSAAPQAARTVAPAPAPQLTAVVATPPTPTPAPTAAALAMPPSAPVPVAGGEIHARILSDGYVRGQEWEAQGKVEKAVAAYAEALKSDPDDEACWRALAKLYEANGYPEYAARCYKGLLQLLPGDQEARAWLDSH